MIAARYSDGTQKVTGGDGFTVSIVDAGDNALAANITDNTDGTYLV
jgi:hypothetical protein